MTAWAPAETFGRVAGVSLDAERVRLVTRPCACGVGVTVEASNPAPAVERHNASLPHRLWWARVRWDWQGEP